MMVSYPEMTDIKWFYDRKCYTDDDVRYFVELDCITEEEFTTITGKTFSNEGDVISSDTPSEGTGSIGSDQVN
ncbi:XkdX family protein [Bacillus subtilis]|uniref:XkdX family protein n=1 Tax=Bacillus subtilis TaxID=1423 RepID=UPI0035138BE6